MYVSGMDDLVARFVKATDADARLHCAVRDAIEYLVSSVSKFASPSAKKGGQCGGGSTMPMPMAYFHGQGGEEPAFGRGGMGEGVPNDVEGTSDFATTFPGGGDVRAAIPMAGGAPKKL